jgi:hypothetical protein
LVKRLTRIDIIGIFKYNKKIRGMKRKGNFKRLTAKKQVQQIEMIRLQQTLAGNAFIYSVIFN